MGETTAISWCDRTWSPWFGCTQVSMGDQGACVGCYARQMHEHRFHRVVFGGPGRGEGTRDVRADSAWAEPLRWDRTSPGDFVFPSMCDPWDNHPDLVEPRRRFVRLMHATPSLTWLPLTKRPGNICKLFREAIGGRFVPDLHTFWPRNAAVGFTAVTQPEFDRDWPKARAAFHALRAPFVFWSGEPLLGGIVLPEDFLALGARAWAITGGESDQGKHRARPSHPDWFRGPRDQCAAAGVPYHHKQNGEYREAFDEVALFEVDADTDEATSFWDAAERPVLVTRDGAAYGHPDAIPDGVPARMLERVGQARAGRLLDGVTHDARPEPRP